MRKIILTVVLILFTVGTAEAGDWAMSVYGCKLSDSSIGDTFVGKAEYSDSYLVTLAISKELAVLWDRLQIESEGQVVKHFGDQDHWAVNFVPVVFRWKAFPWDSYVDTSVAFGFGVSYAFSQPKVEAIGDPDSPKLLGYLVFEVGFGIKQLPYWTLITRLHHRSGAGGTFSGKRDASNAVGVGIRYDF